MSLNGNGTAMDAPLIYTSNGNVPESSLTFEVLWKVYPEGVNYWDERGNPTGTPEAVRCIHIWRDVTGQVVKESAYQLAFKGLPAIGAEQAKFNS